MLVPLSAASARGPAASEQVVFSKTGAFSQSLGPFGFSIWCEAGSANPYQRECNGSMYFYAFGPPKHVIDSSITELAEGQYAIHVISSSDNGASVDCMPTNSPPPTSGPTNCISVSCTEPTTGTATAEGSVVNGLPTPATEPPLQRLRRGRVQWCAALPRSAGASSGLLGW
jgi:hypothetical protein